MTKYIIGDVGRRRDISPRSLNSAQRHGIKRALQAERDDMRERAAKHCNKHKLDERKIKRNGFQSDDEFEAMMVEILAERRGEAIAAEILAQEIRDLK